MRARRGDWLVVKGHRIGEAERRAQILEVRGKRGEPPYVVRWLDDGHEGMFYPGSDAVIESNSKSAAGNHSVSV